MVRYDIHILGQEETPGFELTLREADATNPVSLKSIDTQTLGWVSRCFLMVLRFSLDVH